MIEAFSVGVRVSLIDKVTGGLHGMSLAFAKAHGDAAKLQKQLDSIKFKFMAGGAMAGAGLLGLYSLKGPLEQAKLLEQARAKFATFGMGDAANAEAFRFAQGMNIAGSTYIDNMKRMTEAQGVFRESGKLTLADQLRGAKLAAPLLAKMDFSNSVLNPDLASSRHASALSMLRFVEMRGGVNNPEAFNRIANLGWKAIQSSGGNVSWELYRQFMAHGGSAAQGLSDSALFGQFEPLIGELKGGAGTAWMTAYNRLEGIVKLPNQVAHLLVNSGIWRKDDIIWNSLGGIKQFRDNKSPLVNHASFENTPVSFYKDTILPIYAAMHLDQAGRTRENAVIFGRTGGKMFNLIDRQIVAIQRSIDAQNKALGIDQSYNVAKNTTIGREHALRAQMANIEASIGMAILPMYVAGLKALEPMLWAVSTWTKEHPRQLKVLMGAFVGLSGAIAFGGTVLLLSGAFSGLAIAMPALVAGVGILTSGLALSLGILASPFVLMSAAGVALGVALFGVGYALQHLISNWDTTKGIFWNIKNEFGLFFGWLSAKIHELLAFFGMHPNSKVIAHHAYALGMVQHQPGKGVIASFAAPQGHWATTAIPGKGSIRQFVPDAMNSRPPIHVTVHNTTVLDGKIIARTVAKHMGDEAAGPHTGPSHPDWRLMPMRPSDSP